MQKPLTNTSAAPNSPRPLSRLGAVHTARRYVIAASLCLGPIAQPASADEALEACLAIESAVSRLACFEELTKARAAQRDKASSREESATAVRAEPAQPSAPVTPTAPAASQPAVVTAPPAQQVESRDTASDAAAAPTKKRRRWVPDFGRSEAQASDDPADPAFEVVTRIVKVRRGSRYDPQVMTLANGEVWRENEANVQRIKSDQDVVITRGAVNFSMRLANGRTVLVRRLR